MKLTENLINYIKKEVENIEFGRVIIEVNKTSDKIDIITENRQRFVKGKEYYNG